MAAEDLLDLRRACLAEVDIGIIRKMAIPSEGVVLVYGCEWN